MSWYILNYSTTMPHIDQPDIQMVLPMRIDPKQLKRRRTQLRFSQEALAYAAGLSARQIARIEASHTHAKVRASTAQGLAHALECSVESLAGAELIAASEAGDPAGRTTRAAGTPGSVQRPTSTDIRVNPHALTLSRKWRGMSRRVLAAESGVSERHIARIETADSPVSVRRETAERLARVLYDQDEPLEDELRVPYDFFRAPARGLNRVTPRVQLSARVSHQVRLAYDLVRLRYGPSVREVMVLAPLLFALLAEGSLQWRRQALNEIEDLNKRLQAFEQSGTRRHLYFTKYTGTLQEGMYLEEKSIKEDDVRGRLVRKDAYMRQYDADDAQPFQDYLAGLATDLEGRDLVDFTAGDRITPDPYWGIEPYRLFPEQLEKLTGGSDRARWALEYGDVRLSSIPERLLEDAATDERVQWLESRLSDEVRTFMEEKVSVLDALRTHRAESTGDPA